MKIIIAILHKRELSYPTVKTKHLEKTEGVENGETNLFSNRINKYVIF